MSQFGSLDDTLSRTKEGRHLLASPGPVADAFVASTEPMALLNGPIGSAKTTSLWRKAIWEATRIVPWREGIRRYVPGVFRDKYPNLWNITIPSWWKIFPKEAFPDWVGADGRPATHTIRWRDAWGDVELIARFRSFGEASDPDDARGSEYTDGLFDEMDLMDEEFITALSGRVAREPIREVLGRKGKMYGTVNAPDVLSFVYRDWWEDLKPGFRLYRQPGGLEPGAEGKMGRDYYLDLIEKNQRRQWYIKRMVHNKPGFTRDADVVFEIFDDDRHIAPGPLRAVREVPILVGIDGGNTPAAVYMQELPNGQLRVLAEVALEGSGMIALSREMLAIEQNRFRGCEFYTVCDPAMVAGEATEEGSPRKQLAKLLKRKVNPAATNDPEKRHEPMRGYMERSIEGGQPALLIDPACRRVRRGFNQTFHYHRVRGSNERSRVVKNPDSHVCEAAEYAAMETGQGHARLLESQLQKQMRERMREAREAERYNPLARERA